MTADDLAQSDASPLALGGPGTTTSRVPGRVGAARESRLARGGPGVT